MGLYTAKSFFAGLFLQFVPPEVAAFDGDVGSMLPPSVTEMAKAVADKCLMNTVGAQLFLWPADWDSLSVTQTSEGPFSAVPTPNFPTEA